MKFVPLLVVLLFAVAPSRAAECDDKCADELTSQGPKWLHAASDELAMNIFARAKNAGKMELLQGIKTQDEVSARMGAEGILVVVKKILVVVSLKPDQLPAGYALEAVDFGTGEKSYAVVVKAIEETLMKSGHPLVTRRAKKVASITDGDLSTSLAKIADAIRQGTQRGKVLDRAGKDAKEL